MYIEKVKRKGFAFIYVNVEWIIKKFQLIF